MVAEALSAAVRLERYPKSLIELHVVVLEDDGGVLAAAVSAGSLALADAGIEMVDLVAAATVRVGGGNVAVDPTRAEEAGAALLTLAYMPTFDEVCGLLQEGEVPVDAQGRAVQQCVERCTQVYAVLEAALLADAVAPEHDLGS